MSDATLKKISNHRPIAGTFAWKWRLALGIVEESERAQNQRIFDRLPVHLAQGAQAIRDTAPLLLHHHIKIEKIPA